GPVVGAAMGTLLCGFSDARLNNEQKQNSQANGIKGGKNLRRLIGDGASVEDPHGETRTRIRPDQLQQWLFRRRNRMGKGGNSAGSVLPASCRQNQTKRDRTICRQDAGSTLRVASKHRETVTRSRTTLVK